MLHQALAAAAALLLVGCSASGPGTPSSSDPVELVVFGAASLKGVLEQARTAYEGANPGTSLTISTDSSATLVTQIEQGAPVDVFLSADTNSPQRLVDDGLATGGLVPFAGNALAVIVPVGNPAGLASPAGLANAGVKVIAAGDQVPITTYATRLVANLAQQPGYPVGFESAYAANVVSREENVKAVVAKIELGEGDAGIVYLTDATAARNVEMLDVPEDANVSATYAGVVVEGSDHRDAAAAFLDWLAGADGRAMLQEFGFLPAP